MRLVKCYTPEQKVVYINIDQISYMTKCSDNETLYKIYLGCGGGTISVIIITESFNKILKASFIKENKDEKKKKKSKKK